MEIVKLKKIVLAVLILCGAINANGADTEWWQYSIQGKDCVPAATGNMTPQQIQSIVKQNHGTVDVHFENDENQLYLCSQ